MALAIGIAIIFLFRTAALMPGSLSSAHALFEMECHLCHQDIDEPSPLWLSQIRHAGLFSESVALENSSLCLNCHSLGSGALHPHSLNSPEIVQLSQQERSDHPSHYVATPKTETRVARALLPESFQSRVVDDTLRQPLIGCVHCHNEHDGRNADIASMTDARCHACHTQSFGDFDNHPEFIDYPYKSSADVSFNHRTHFSRHFTISAEKGLELPASCGGCHVSDSQGQMSIRGFETCASCHEEDITAPPVGSPAMTFLTPPGLDLERLEGANIGDWPLYAEDEPNAFLTFLLRAGGYMDPNDLSSVIELDLLDLTDANEEQIHAVVSLAWGFKMLVNDLLQSGPDIFVAPARVSSGDSLHHASMVDLAASLSFEVVSEATQLWFPNLADDLDRFGHEPVPTLEIDNDYYEPEEIEDMDEWFRYGGWRIDELALVYRPTGHADRFFRSWLEWSTALNPATEDLFDYLVSETPAEVCVSCHVVDEETIMASRRGINWFAFRFPSTAVQPAVATRSGMSRDVLEMPKLRQLDSPFHLRIFSHYSHSQVIASDGCVHCHTIAVSEATQDSTTGFSRMALSTCQSCHSQVLELSTCTSCHQYHFIDHGESLISDKLVLQNSSTPTPAYGMGLTDRN